METSEAVLAQISKRDNPQTVLGAYKQHLHALSQLDGATVIALQGVRDPGNLGTILRTADSVGAGGVVLVGESCDPFSVEAVRASMGSLFADQARARSFAEMLAYKQARGAGTAWRVAEGPRARRRIHAAAARAIVLMGNEQSGLSEEMEAACDLLVKLPMRGRADSLNLAVATALMVYDLWRRRGYDGASA